MKFVSEAVATEVLAEYAWESEGLVVRRADNRRTYLYRGLPRKVRERMDASSDPQRVFCQYINGRPAEDVTEEVAQTGYWFSVAAR